MNRTIEFWGFLKTQPNPNLSAQAHSGDSIQVEKHSLSRDGVVQKMELLSSHLEENLWCQLCWTIQKTPSSLGGLQDDKKLSMECFHIEFIHLFDKPDCQSIEFHPEKLRGHKILWRETEVLISR